jgi:type IV pilus assembly protein PilX
MPACEVRSCKSLLYPDGRCGQSGAALVVSLLFLLLMTIIGVTAMQTNTLEERMAGNARDLNVAFQAAESALRDGEDWLAGLTIRPDPVGTFSATATAPSPTRNLWRLDSAWIFMTQADAAWWTDFARQYGAALDGTYAPPRFVLEEDRFVPDSLKVGVSYPSSGKWYYRVTARGIGGAEVTQSLLQTMYMRRY